jgi:LEA14-like dessication related protein
MKTIIKTLIIASVPFIFSILLMSTFADQTLAIEKASKITFKETKHDFGKVKEGVELTIAFKFKNEGNENLVIQKVHASCGCTGAAIGDKKEFKKGEEGEIKVSFNTGRRSGTQSKTVTVESNDPENPTVVLSFACEIISQ